MAKHSPAKKSRQPQQGGRSGGNRQQQQASSGSEEFPRNQGENTEQDYIDEVSETHLEQRNMRE